MNEPDFSDKMKEREKAYSLYDEYEKKAQKNISIWLYAFLGIIVFLIIVSLLYTFGGISNSKKNTEHIENITSRLDMRKEQIEANIKKLEEIDSILDNIVLKNDLEKMVIDIIKKHPELLSVKIEKIESKTSEVLETPEVNDTHTQTKEQKEFYEKLLPKENKENICEVKE